MVTIPFISLLVSRIRCRFLGSDIEMTGIVGDAALRIQSIHFYGEHVLPGSFYHEFHP